MRIKTWMLRFALALGFLVIQAPLSAHGADPVCTDITSRQVNRRVPVFADRKLIGEFDVSDANTVRTSGLSRGLRDLLKNPKIARDIPRLDPRNIDPQRSLLITANSVTGRLDLDPANALGRYPFAFLMNQLAAAALGGPASANATTEYILEWLRESERHVPTVNGWPREPVVDPDDNPVIARWRMVDGANRLHAEGAPFKLLAVVNRVDLREDSGVGAGSAGELRFVFAADVATNRSFLVIMEYAVNRKDLAGVQAWAADWCSLGRMRIDSPEYHDKLTAMMRPVVSFDRASGRPPSLRQVRTNENLLRPDGLVGQWRLREFRRDKSGQLRQATVSRTPRQSLNAQPALADYLASRGQEVRRPGYELRDRDGRGKPFRGDGIVYDWNDYWNVVPATNPPDLAHQFALRTCNGCHHLETKVLGEHEWSKPVAFAHVFLEFDGSGPRVGVSPFLSGAIDVPDRRTGEVHRFDEMRRRQCYLDSLVKGLSTTRRCAVGVGMTH